MDLVSRVSEVLRESLQRRFLGTSASIIRLPGSRGSKL
jgi:hypothetical protein